MDWFIDGRMHDWPASLWIIRERVGVSMTCAPYTDDDDNSAPEETQRACRALEGDFQNKAAAVAAAVAAGFVAD